MTTKNTYTIGQLIAQEVARIFIKRWFMKKSKAKQIQTLLTKHLLDCGKINLLLPNGVTLEIGITKETKHGEEISDDYCFVKASRDGSATLLDSYKAELQCADRDNAILCVDTMLDENGNRVKRLEYI